MLKRIEPGDVELGMFIHKLEGNWLRHPFWRARFLLTDETRMHKLRDSQIDGVVIDTARGRDIASIEARKHGAASAAPAAAKAIGSATGPSMGIRRRSLGESAGRAVASGGGDGAKAGTDSFDLRSVAPQSVAREFGQAVRVAERSRKAISRVFIEARLGKTIKAGLVEPVVNEIFASVQRNPHAFNGLMRCKRDNEYAYRHALTVSALMISLGRQMKLAPEMLKQAGLAGLLLDVGIGHLPIDHAALDGDHRRIDPAVLRAHVRLGHDLLTAGGIAEPVARACLEHHERADGEGYPGGLKSRDISLLGRMAAICDVYDELANDANGTAGLDPAAAIERMASMAGAFDTELMQTFIEAMGVYPIGSLVLLRSGRLAMVTDQSPDDISRPKVRAFFSVVTGGRISPVDIALGECFGEDAIEGTASAETYGIADLPSLREHLFEKQAAAGPKSAPRPKRARRKVDAANVKDASAAEREESIEDGAA